MILITGASGFLGRRTVQLALERGLPVRALVRRPTAELDLPPNCIYQGDVTDPATLSPAVEGATAVIHAAATTSETAPDEVLSRRTNFEGTRNLLEACRQVGVQRFVHISSLSANSKNTSVYGRTKFAADEEVRRCGLRWTILQPGTIYGPGGRGLFAKMVRMTSGGLPIVPMLGNGKQTMRPIFVDDCVNAALDCIDHEASVGQTYTLGCSDAITFNDFVRGFLKAQGKRKVLVHVPLWFCFPVARVLGLVLKKPPVTVDNLVGIKQMKAPAIDAAQRDFGFAPVTFAEGLRRTFEAVHEPAAAPAEVLQGA
jgi:NADH dehydrogenase